MPRNWKFPEKVELSEDFIRRETWNQLFHVEIVGFSTALSKSVNDRIIGLSAFGETREGSQR